MLVSLYVDDLFGMDWGVNGTKPKWKLVKYTTNPDHTYFVIFSQGQQREYEMFKKEHEQKGFTILLDAVHAVNKTPGHGTKPRNKLVVFEYNGK